MGTIEKIHVIQITKNIYCVKQILISTNIKLLIRIEIDYNNQNLCYSKQTKNSVNILGSLKQRFESRQSVFEVLLSCLWFICCNHVVDFGIFGTQLLFHLLNKKKKF